jgi:hypothetical protein
MPNWCDNSISITHEDPAMMQRLDKAFKEGNFLNEFVPCPPELLEEVGIGENYRERSEAHEAANIEKFGHASWYSWRVENWGTKWEVGEGEFDYDPETNKATGWFQTAWSPPVTAMEALTELGFIVELKYREEGMSFVGEYTSEDGDECYNVDFEDEDWRDDIPEHLIDDFNLEDDYENWLEWNKEDEDEESDDSEEIVKEDDES